MPTIGYGEDGLTFQALHEKRQELLNLLGDPTPQAECTVFFRPSFGRGKLYGEFDGILVTNTTIYLIEAKWTQKPKLSSKFEINKAQQRRHKIFRWLIEEWRELRVKENSGELAWGTFHAERRADFHGKFKPRRLPDTDKLLAKNLHWILNNLTAKHYEICDLLLHFYPDKQPETGVNTAPTGFKMVQMPHDTEGQSCFFKLKG